MTLPTGEMHRTAASDLDEPTDGVDADLKFEGSVGTAAMVGIRMELGSGMQLGLEGSFIGHNFDEVDVPITQPSMKVTPVQRHSAL